MISFRYHIVSIVAVFFALAIGVLLGSGPLAGTTQDRAEDGAGIDSAARGELEAEIAQQRQGLAFVDDFASTIAPTLVGDRLRGRTVTMVVLPTARQDDVRELADMVSLAGGNVGGTVRIGDQLVDASGKQLVDELGSQLERRTPDVRVPADANPYERIGALIARAVGTSRRGGAPAGDTSTSILAGMSAADLMSTVGRFTRRGDLVLFVTGAGEGSAEQRRGTGTIITSLTRAVDERTDGVVLVGPAAAARDDGQLAAVRADVGAAREVSTVDTVDRIAAQVVTMLALAGQAAGQTGQYGAVDAADGAVPGAQDG